jgi:pimeloyl-ACP methyl ester carboxylesterase
VRRVLLNGVAIEYEEHGTGVPVVFSHGGSSDLRYWFPQRGSFAARYRFVTYSRRKGDVPAAVHVADLIAMVRRLEAEPVHLVGFSTAIGLRAALDEPELLRTLTIVEPNVPWMLEDAAADAELLAHWRDENERIRAEAETTASSRPRCGSSSSTIEAEVRSIFSPRACATGGSTTSVAAVPPHRRPSR